MGYDYQRVINTVTGVNRGRTRAARTANLARDIARRYGMRLRRGAGGAISLTAS